MLKDSVLFTRVERILYTSDAVSPLTANQLGTSLNEHLLFLLLSHLHDCRLGLHDIFSSLAGHLDGIWIITNRFGHREALSALSIVCHRSQPGRDRLKKLVLCACDLV